MSLTMTLMTALINELMSCYLIANRKGKKKPLVKAVSRCAEFE
jgi:hypothetical protein